VNLLLQNREKPVFSKTKYCLFFMFIMVGLLICGPTITLGDVAQRWSIEIESFGFDDEHIAGDTFRVEVRFSNRTPGWMHNVVAEVHYPIGAEPLLARFHKRMVSRFPWEGHFIDYDKHIIRFNYPDSIANSTEKFYAFFTATKYGKIEFNYVIRWLSSDSLLYEQTIEGQNVFFNGLNSQSEAQNNQDSAVSNGSGSQNVSTRTVDDSNSSVSEIVVKNPQWSRILMAFLWLILLAFYIATMVMNNRRFSKLNKAVDVLIQTQKELVSIEIERSKCVEDIENE